MSMAAIIVCIVGIGINICIYIECIYYKKLNVTKIDLIVFFLPKSKSANFGLKKKISKFKW